MVVTDTYGGERCDGAAAFRIDWTGISPRGFVSQGQWLARGLFSHGTSPRNIDRELVATEFPSSETKFQIKDVFGFLALPSGIEPLSPP
jgi:hypothetical protein